MFMLCVPGCTEITVIMQPEGDKSVAQDFL